jgi:hypothetical protein
VLLALLLFTYSNLVMQDGPKIMSALGLLLVMVAIDSLQMQMSKYF